jgi:lipopolysaccharide/colanic/teichoic acid biosynthesis glycosyltransferase
MEVWVAVDDEADARPGQGMGQRFAKRALDVFVSGVALVVLSPLLIVLAAAVRLDSQGPALFKQERVGRGGRPFRIYKLRSMVRDAERMAGNVSPTGDPRVTRVGAFLRKWYLDELPQLFNVLKGDMSLVGPRPETPGYVAHYTEDERRVLAMKPGVAGPSTLAFMDEARLLDQADDPEDYYVSHLLHERVRLDLRYVDRRSLLGDVRLLLRQVWVIVSGRSTAGPAREHVPSPGAHPSGTHRSGDPVVR